MKNNLTFTIATAVMGMLSIGCNKDSVSPNTHQTNFNNSLNYVSKADHNAFRAVQNENTILLVGTPEKAKQVVGIMDRSVRGRRVNSGLNKKTTITELNILIWTFVAPSTSEQISIKFNTDIKLKASNSAEIERINIVDFRKYLPLSTIKRSKTEIFALDRVLTQKELDELQHMNRGEFRNYCGNVNNNLNIVKSAIVQEHEAAIKDLTRSITKATEDIKLKEAKKAEAKTDKNLAILDFDINTLKQNKNDYQHILDKVNTLLKPSTTSSEDKTLVSLNIQQ